MLESNERELEQDMQEAELFDEVEEIVTASWMGCAQCCSG